MKVQKEFVLREIAGDYVIIPTGKTVLSFNGLITVNEVGADLWKMLQSEVTFDDLLHGILESYDVDEETAREDIREFLDTLIEGGVLDDPAQQPAGEEQSKRKLINKHILRQPRGMSLWLPHCSSMGKRKLFRLRYNSDLLSSTALRASSTPENTSPNTAMDRKRHSGSASSAFVPYLPRTIKR